MGFIEGGALYQSFQNLETVMPPCDFCFSRSFEEKLDVGAREEIGTLIAIRDGFLFHGKI